MNSYFMAVGRKDKTDKKLEAKADLIISGVKYANRSVYGYTLKPNKRDIFVPSAVSKNSIKLPSNAKVIWYGRSYNARLSFRNKANGGSIPVYTFNV